MKIKMIRMLLAFTLAATALSSCVAWHHHHDADHGYHHDDGGYDHH